MCSVKLINEDPDQLYDWSSDVLSSQWDGQAAFQKLLSHKDSLVCDVLLDQDIFSGIGNVIRNEVLYRTGIHPLSVVGRLKRYKLMQLVKEARDYSHDFLRWKKEGVLSTKWNVHRKEICPRHETPLKVKIMGNAKRKAYYCDKCQTLYI